MSNDAVQAWLSRARESLEVARELLNQDRFGFAAHHAYYGMLYAASAALRTEALAFTRHSAVIAAFGQHFAKTGRLPVHLHRFLIQAEELRIAADYTEVDPTTREEAQMSLAWASEFVGAVDALFGPKHKL